MWIIDKEIREDINAGTYGMFENLWWHDINTWTTPNNGSIDKVMNIGNSIRVSLLTYSHTSPHSLAHLTIFLTLSRL